RGALCAWLARRARSHRPETRLHHFFEGLCPLELHNTCTRRFAGGLRARSSLAVLARSVLRYAYTLRMKFEPFALERFQSIWENRVAWNVAESGVHPLRVSELADTEAFRDAVLEQELGYPQTNGTVALREAIAAMYPGATIDHVQVTNGGSEANCVLLMRLVEAGDEIVFMSPNYMQIAGLARALGATVKPWRASERKKATERTEPTEYRWDLDELKEL